MMKLKDIQREKHEVQRRIDFLQKLNKFDTLDDLELLKEMKIELRSEYSVASEPFNPLQRAIHSER